ncbi:dephospho-CoA kinase [Tellurirhabdus bombi]|uniref:dephospho-CoA kinase n=1 Tax=Tellurirhabdus bombi TaxID=2907205 RepID=UPI001EEABA1F|nr:dephospho-CoA kinase [Tellurirhabdus bombi]
MNASEPRPLQIGVTGGIGTGKSLVCRIFNALGIPVYEADERAKWLVNHDAILRADIIRLLGPNAYMPAGDLLSGQYNRAWVAAQVFNHPERLQSLNALIHPRVYADTASWVTTHQHLPYVVKEAAIMKAAGDGNTLDKVIVVQAPLELRLQRIRKRDPHRTEEEIINIINRQATEAERLAIADFVIHNDEKSLLIPQVIQLHRLFSSSQNA